MAFTSDSICSICCENFSQSQSNLGHLLHFQKLCSYLNAVTVGEDATATCSSATINITSESERVKQFNSLAISEIGKLISVICPDCLVSVSSTLTAWDQLNSLEEEVRQLQRKILQLLNNLQGNVKTFKAEVDKMEAIVEGSRDNVRSLDNFYCSGANKGRGFLKDAIKFRMQVLTVFEDLRNFNNNLEAFYIPDCTTTATGRLSGEVNVNSSNTAPHGRSRDRPRRGRNPVQTEASDREEEEEISNNNMDYHDNYTGNFMEGSLEEDGGVTGSLDIDDYKIDYPFNGNSSAQNSDIESNSVEQSEDDEEYLPPVSSSAKSTRKKTERNPFDNGSQLQLQAIDFSNMTTFKKNLISRIMKRKETQYKASKKNRNSKKQQKTPEELEIEELDPRNSLFIHYDPSKTNTLTLRDIDITIDEQEESLQCTNCDFKCFQSKARAGHAYEFENAMYNHVIGRHFKLFSCPHCHRDRFGSFKLLRAHILSHDNRYVCDICGKPLGGANTLKNHKWLHLSEQEKAEAVKNGVKSPEEEYMRVKEAREKRHKCSTCGKSYFNSYDLRKHEECTHASNRPQHMCSLCGKTFRRSGGLSTHLKYVCYPDKGEMPRARVKRFQCDQCPKAFALPCSLQRHQRDRHSIQPLTYKCSLCERKFRTKGCLTVHERSHLDVKPVV